MHRIDDNDPSFHFEMCLFQISMLIVNCAISSRSFILIADLLQYKIISLQHIIIS